MSENKISITKDFIMSAGQNPSAVKNGADLVKKGSFTAFYIDGEQTIIFGVCKGSGKNPYFCSADFIDSQAPVYRCTCPSRQIPCKHVLGLMWAYAEGNEFGVENIPEDIVQKRANKEKRLEKKLEKQKEDKPEDPKKNESRKRAAVKKIDAQLNGIREGEKLLEIITDAGIGSIDAKALSGYSIVIKQLDSYYISGIQNEFFSLLELLRDKSDESFKLAAIKVCQIQALLNRSTAYLQEKKNDPDKLEITSEIEELIGYPWKLDELKKFGLFEENAELVQLAFHVVNEPDKKQYVDEGYYVNLKSGGIFITKNYRPYKALKHIKEENSVSTIVNVKELYIYPSVSLNPRIRWDSAEFTEITPEICAKINSLGNDDFTSVIKAVKNQLKSIILNPYPAVLMKFSKIYCHTPGTQTGYKNSLPPALSDCFQSFCLSAPSSEFVMEDKNANRILLRQNPHFPENFIHLLSDIKKTDLINGSVLAVFHSDPIDGILSAHPLALITRDKIIKLLF